MNKTSSIVSRRLRKDLQNLIMAIREKPLSSLSQLTIPLYTTIAYTNNPERPRISTDGRVVIVEEYIKRISWDVAKAVMWYGAYKLLTE